MLGCKCVLRRVLSGDVWVMEWLSGCCVDGEGSGGVQRSMKRYRVGDEVYG